MSGQITCSALTGRSIGRGSPRPAIAPISQNGIARAKSNRKYLRGDLLSDALAFMACTGISHIKLTTATTLLSQPSAIFAAFAHSCQLDLGDPGLNRE